MSKTISVSVTETLRLSDNMKVRSVYEMLLNHSNVRRIQEKPVVLQWYSSECDVYDTYDSKTPKLDKKEQAGIAQEVHRHINHKYHKMASSTEKDNFYIRIKRTAKIDY